MKRLLIGGILAMSAIGFDASVAVAQSKTEQELIQLERDWRTAQVKRDGALLSRILGDDFTGVAARGATETKTEVLAGLKDMSNSGECLDKDLKVRVYGDAAVVTGLATCSGTNKGVAFKDRQYLWTDTFVRRDGRWQCVASQSTAIPAPQK